jgi:1,4-alpha-glucan branching enzyme
MTARWTTLFLLLACQNVFAQAFPRQSYDLVPQKADGGILFQCRAPNAKAVYLAGDFNGWAQNVDGRISKPEFAMTGPDTNGVWRKIVKLDAGTYKFKFNLDGEPDSWFAPETVDETDADKNAVFRVTGAGEVVIRSARNPKWAPQVTDDGVLFQLYAPEAHVVYLAGDFNAWGKNRDGLVYDPQFALSGPDADGVWRVKVELPAGRSVYQFVVDGDGWMTDPNAVENDSENHSVVVAP